MTDVRLTLVQIDNCRPWMVVPDPQRKIDLQTLQLRLSTDSAQYISSHNGYAFFTRFDNMVAVTNGLDRDDRELLQESIANRYPVTLSLGIDVSRSPAVALERAIDHIQRVGNARDGGRREVPSGETLADADRTGADPQIARFDVNDATGKYTDRLSRSDTFIHIEQGYASLTRHLREEHSALSFFIDDDNIISVTPDLTEDQYRDATNRVGTEADVELKAGVGTASDVHEAGFAVKYMLEDCRHRDTTIEYTDATVETAND